MSEKAKGQQKVYQSAGQLQYTQEGYCAKVAPSKQRI